MNPPRLRSVAVAAGFLGVTMVVAGAATAMTTQPSDEPVATAVVMDHAEASEPAMPSPAGEAPAATAVEVPAAPIECTPEGVCGARAHEASTVTSDAAPPVDDRAPASSPEAASATACELPARPDLPEHGDREAWEQTARSWLDDVKAAAHECGLDRGDWRAVLGEREWKDLAAWSEGRGDRAWGDRDKGHHGPGERGTSDRAPRGESGPERSEHHGGDGDRDPARHGDGPAPDGHGRGDRDGPRASRWDHSEGWGDRSR